ncbi:hypothetical protein KUCAC02_014787 [Chaenocephalus aceratus]|uniref:Uncharacterized protein n=1 Tax=Chaenocephalus aceratus TaxID=36190 RepID=A0ACB9WFM3_CHAAC|nr:hypothetical protein KUCAC02_014787 [Chaenocephalus aceratus]
MGWSQPVGSSGPQLSPYSVSALSDAELHRRVVQPQQSMLSSHMDVQKEPWLPELHPQPVQWKVDGGEVMPLPQQQHAAPQQNQFDSQSNQGQQQHHQSGPGWPDSPLITQSVTSALSSESSHMKDSAPAIVSSHMVAVSKKSSASTVSEIEQQRLPKPIIWSSPPTSTVLASTSSLQHGFSTPLSFIDGRALWSIRPALLANSQSSPNKLGQELQLPRWAGVPVSIQKEPSTHTKKEDTRVWDLINPQVIPSTVIHTEKPWNGCELPKQWVSGLPGVSTSAQIDQSSAMPISTPVSHGLPLLRSLLSLCLAHTLFTLSQLAHSQDLHTQIFFCTTGSNEREATHATDPAPTSVFPTGRNSQTWLPFAFCPRTASPVHDMRVLSSRELDLQMHYMQHAQGEI